MKKVLALGLALLLVCSMFAACGAQPQSGMTVGVIQLVEHPSLDEIYTALEAQINTLAKEQNKSVTIEYENAQGDMSTISTIAQQFVAKKVDVIVAIATPSALGAAAAIEGTDIPMVFSAVTDPVAVQLVQSLDAPGGNITGTSDYIDVEKIFTLAAELTPQAKTFGLLYNTSEPNSVSVIANAKAYFEKNGIKVVESAVTSANDVQTAAQNLMGKCDAVFVPIDNTVASAMSVLTEVANAAKKPVYVAADSMVADGGLATVGVNYTLLGKETANIVLRVLGGEAAGSIPVKVLDETQVVVNTETAAAIGVDVSKYAK